MNPAQFQPLLATGLAHHQAGRLADAERCYAQARAAQPQNFDALHLSGALAYQQSRYSDAESLLQRALRLNPKSAACAMRLGLALSALDRAPAAEGALQSALRLDPKLVDAWLGLAIVARKLGKIPEATAAYQRVIALKPDVGEAHDQLGVLIGETQGPAAALPHHERAVAANPRSVTAWCNLGLAQVRTEKFAEALESFSRALALEPAHVQSKVGRALALQQTYQLTEAAAEYTAAVALAPAHTQARSARLLTLQYLANISDEERFREHRAFGESVEPNDTPLRPAITAARDARPRVRIAFLSADLRTHSVAYFLEPLLAHLDRSHFEIVLYHDHFVVDATSTRLRGLADAWRNFNALADAQVETIIRADAPDVLVDLSGHTGINRLPLFAKRLAPVQITYLGYPDTTGLRAMDFRFVDSVTDPEAGDRGFHTEQLVRFSPCAWTYLPPKDAPAILPRSESAPLVFGSFNNPAKLSPETLAAWAEILRREPGARLRIKGAGLHQALVRRVMENKLRGADCDLERVELIGRTADVGSHLQVYQEVDVALDPFPYNGTTTTCEALWMGVPVITRHGERHAARVGASLLNAVGHPEWIATADDAYVRIACETAHRARADAGARARLRDEMSRSLLMDHAEQSRRFGEAVLACRDAKFCSPQL